MNGSRRVKTALTLSAQLYKLSKNVQIHTIRAKSTGEVKYNIGNNI